MKKLALVLFGVGVVICVFNQSFEAGLGLSGYPVGLALMLAGCIVALRARLGAKSHAFRDRATEGGFLS